MGIIGGGSTGLYAGLLLDSLNIDYTIIEASETRLGGRIFSYEFDTNQQSSESNCQPIYTNLGGALFVKNDLMERLTGNESWSLINFLNEHVKEEYKIEEIPAFTTNLNNINFLNGIAATVGCRDNHFDVHNFSQSNGGSIPDEYVKIPPRQLLCPFVNVLDSLMKNFTGEILNTMNDYDHLTASQFLQLETRTFTKPYSDDVIDYIKRTLAIPCDFNASALEMIMYLLMGSDSTSEWIQIHGGTYNIIRAMASLLKGNIIRDVVTRVECNQFGKVIVTTKRGIQHIFDHLITTPSLRALSHIEFDSSCGISGEKMNAIRTAKYSSSANAALKFNHMFWEDSKLMNGMAFSGGFSVTDLRVGLVLYDVDRYYCTSYNGSKPGTMRLLIHKKRDFNESIDSLLDDLEKMYGSLVRQYFSGEYFIEDWTTNPFILGGWAEFEPSFYSKYQKTLTLPEFNGRIHVAGEGTSFFHGWIVGSLNSAYRAVRNVLAQVDPNYIEIFEEMWGPYNEPMF